MKERTPIFLDKKKQQLFELNGYVVLNLLNSEEIKELSEAYKSEDFGNPEGFYSTSFSKDEVLKTKLTSLIEAKVEAKAQKILTPFTSLGSCYLAKAPGEKSTMPWHQDWTVVDETQYDSMTIWIALQDVNEQNGAMKVIPGSHRFSDLLRSPLLGNPLSEIESELEKDAQFVNLKAGQAIIFSQALMHASPPNLSNEKRLAVTYGFIPKTASLFFYYKNEAGLIEKYQVPNTFFKRYNTQIGQRPSDGKLLETRSIKETKITLEEYKLMKARFSMKKNKMTNMKPLFKNPEHQSFFENKGYLVLPLLNKEEVQDLKDYYHSLGLVDEKGFGFHVSMDGLDEAKCKEVKEKVWSVILPKMDEYVENYKPFVASYVVKETNPKGVVPAHQDWSFVEKEEEGYCSVTCWTTLVDTHLDNGCMGVIKGSRNMMNNHRPSPSPQTPVPLSEHMFSIFPYLTTLEMKAGEVLFFDNRTFHASPPNTTDGLRLAAGVGITQKDAQLIHYYLKPDGNKNTLLKYKVDEDFFLKYDNARLAKMYDAGQVIEDYELLAEVPYHYDDYSSEELVALMKEAGNEFNVPMCEKLSVLFGYDMSGKKKEAPKEEEKKEVVESSPEPQKSFFEVYTPMNILREVKLRLTGK
jgi:ectoine hydroxylase-related dioxygenase (phytanoyl-CoA dioxygenase family)